MKLKRLLAGALALVMVLTMSILPASAATMFPDIQTHWAKSYIETMTTAGMFKGYDDGNFKPENKLTTAEALALCARAVGLDSSTTGKITTNRYEDVKTTLRGDQSWFYQEFAVCLETGILDLSDLKALYQSDALTRPIAKEDLAVYLVRAMQLGPMSERLSSYPMHFNDVSSISASARPSVYLLNVYGIVEGDQYNEFGPRGQVTRAIMSTMLTRSIAYMQAHGTSPDLSEYTSYDFQQGTIAMATTSGGVTSLSLNSDLTGASMPIITLPSSVTIYENNMTATSSALKVGRHARVCYGSNGSIVSVRVSEAPEVFEATVNGIEGNAVAVTVGSTGQILTMDRFTQVQIGTKTVGDRSIVSKAAGYTTATCKLDDQGRLIAIQFVGGTRQAEGILSDYTRTATNDTLQVVGFDGVTRTYTIPSTATITINGVPGSLSRTMEEHYVALHLSEEDNSVQSVSIDTLTEYVQGVVTNVSTSKDTISLRRLSNDRTTTYDVDSSAVITYDGESTSLKRIKRNYFATLRLSDDYVTMIQASPSSAETKGVISDRIFDPGNVTTFTFVVTQDNGTKVSFKVDLSDPPVVERNEEDSSVDKLRIGDEVIVTVRYNSVSRITANTQSVNVSGTVERIIQEKSGYTLDMVLSSGEKVSYTIHSNVAVTQNNKDVALSSLRPGYKLGLAVTGDAVTSIEVQQIASSGSKVSGSIIFADQREGYLYVRTTTDTGEEEMVTVRINGSVQTKILDVNTGKELDSDRLDTGDVIEANGSYTGTIFEATVILRQ